MRFTDPDGRTGNDVILGGSEKQKAFTELQASVKGQLNLSMDANGKVSYAAVEGAKINADAKQLTTAIDDHSITVNVDATNGVTTSEGAVLAGGAFMGNTVTCSPTPGGQDKVNAKQEVNPSQLKTQSDYYGKPGADMLHEATEGYQGAKISQTSGVSSPSSLHAGSVYEAAHNKATPQSGMQYVDTQDANGKSVNSQVPGGRLVYFVQEGNRNPAIILTYPIPPKK